MDHVTTSVLQLYVFFTLVALTIILTTAGSCIRVQESIVHHLPGTKKHTSKLKISFVSFQSVNKQLFCRKFAIST